MKYNRTVKHKDFKITYIKATIPYKKVIFKPKSKLLKEFENLTKLQLNSSYGISSAYNGFSFRGGKTKKTMYA